MVVDNKIYEKIIWPYRLVGNLLLLGCIWALTLGVITVRHNLVGKQIDSLLSDIYAKTAAIGWGLDDVTLEGRNRTSIQAVLEATGLKRGDNILEVDLRQICDNVQMLPWVKKAVVTRRYFPNVIHISIVEKTVKSIWQYKNEFYPIDEDGEIINKDSNEVVLLDYERNLK